MQMADAYSTREIITLLGISRQAIDKRAKREAWKSVPRLGRGGGYFWQVASMPPSTRDAIASALLRETQTASCAAVGTAPVAVRPADTAPAVSCPTACSCAVAAHSPEWFRATAREREIASARLAFVREIERLSVVVKKEGAIRHLVEASRTRSLSPVLLDLITTATACRRGGALSRRSLYRWASDYAAGGEVALLPTMSRTMPLPAWMQEFLAHYQKPQHPPVSQAYDDFAAALRRRGETPPSVYAVRRALAKMSTPAKEAGRATGNALLKLRPHRRRDTSELWPGDVYTADGTTFDAEVLHPLHGQPFKPELTAIIDVATRRCVGISIALAESKLTVLDALRMACMWAGIPAMFYSDNGPGYSNNLMLDDRTGMLQRLGITPCHAIPGRPQGKGLMERAVKTLWVRAAQGLESYTGALMDPDAAHANYRRSRKALRNGRRAVLPTWKEAKKHILARVEEYNATPHRGLRATAMPRVGMSTSAPMNTGPPSRRAALSRCACRKAWARNCSCRASGAWRGTPGWKCSAAVTMARNWPTTTARPWKSAMTFGTVPASGAGPWTAAAFARPRWRAIHSPTLRQAGCRPRGTSARGRRSHGLTPGSSAWLPARRSACRGTTAPRWRTASSPRHSPPPLKLRSPRLRSRSRQRGRSLAAPMTAIAGSWSMPTSRRRPTRRGS